MIDYGRLFQFMACRDDMGSGFLRYASGKRMMQPSQGPLMLLEKS